MTFVLMTFAPKPSAPSPLTALRFAAISLLVAGSSLLAIAENTPVPSPAQPTQAYTGIRIVRLSQVNGDVQLDRNVGQGYGTAFLNLPVTEGSRLRTDQGVAEVEFEDNTTLRLTPGTTIEFTVLRRDVSGRTVSEIKVVDGTLFASTAPTRGNTFTLTSAHGKLLVEPSTHVRLFVGSPQTTASVLDGSVQAQVGTTTTIAGKKTTLRFDPADQAAPTLVSHVDKTPYDAWDKQAADYHSRFTRASQYGYGGSAPYGASDLSYYGYLSDAGSCGAIWRPYLATAAWDPYTNGILAYYPGSGYSWASSYPWGWLPYHSGSWVNCPGTGWGWQPGRNFSGLANVSEPLFRQHGIKPPPRAPVEGRKPGFLGIGSPTPATSRFVDGQTFLFSRDSAGLGVPRGTFNDLAKISRSTLAHGTELRPAYIETAGSAPRVGQAPVAFTHAGISPTRLSSSSLSASGDRGSSGFASSSTLSSPSAGSSISTSSVTSGAHAAISTGGAHH